MNKQSILPVKFAFIALLLSACSSQQEVKQAQVVATMPLVESVTITQQYVCQIRSGRHIELRALDRGYLEAVPIKDGQMVKAGELMFRIIPDRSQTNLDAENAQVLRFQKEYDQAKKQFEEQTLSQDELQVAEARLKKSQADLRLAMAQLSPTDLKAPFNGRVARLRHQPGSLVQKGEILTSLTDNSQMRVYFNVPEQAYFEYMARQDEAQDQEVDLVLSNGKKYGQSGKISAIHSVFNTQTGTIPFRADFPNPEGVLRQGQTGDVLVQREVHDAVVIPQRSTFEMLGKRYVYVIDKDEIVQQREVAIQNELDDIYIVSSGVDTNDRIILDGISPVRVGDKVECVVRPQQHVTAIAR